MYQVKRTFRGSCPRHRRYNPDTQGFGGIKGGCVVCKALFEIQEAARKFDLGVRMHAELSERIQRVERSMAAESKGRQREA
jgi:hypothetical protein